jgi:hypothetical protein
MFDGTQQLRVFLAHDLVELRCPHSGLLHLLEWFSGIDALVLLGVPNEQNPVLWPNLFEKRLHLPSAGKTGFVKHIKVPGVRVSRAAVDSSPREKTLQGVSLNTGIPELTGGSACGSEALDRVSVPFCALTDDLKGRGLAAARQPLQTMYPVV